MTLIDMLPEIWSLLLILLYLTVYFIYRFKEEEARSHEDTEIPHELEHAEVLGDHCNRLSDIVGKMVISL